MVRVVESFRRPNHLDKEPYQTIWKHIDEKGRTTHYLQANKIEGKICWIPVGYLLEQYLGDEITTNEALINTISPDDLDCNNPHQEIHA